MKLRTQILALGVVGLILTTLVGGTGLLNANKLSEAFDNSINMGLALQKSQEADMMHDAIRGDVLLALLSGQTQDYRWPGRGPKRPGRARRHLQKGHDRDAGTADFRPAPKQLWPRWGQRCKAYVESATAVQKLATTDATGGNCRHAGISKGVQKSGSRHGRAKWSH